ncbi:MAG: hypothetical protein LUC91_09985 [Prevotella sp.]|nr:hypothetical protein [Prevotella sp.]
MNKIFSYCAMLLFSVLAFSLVSCTEEYEYTGATAEGEQVYFSNTLSSTVELTSSESSFQIPVNRMNTSGSLTVPLEINLPYGSNCEATTSSVTFADGASVAYLTFTYDPTNIDYGVYDEITVAISDASYTTPYGSSSYSFSAGMSEWKTMDGYATYREALLTSLYSAPELTYEVEIQESVVTPGRYRLVNAYTANNAFGQEYGYFFSFADGDHYITIDATDPNYVYLDDTFYTGAYYTEEGEILFFSYVMYYVMNGYSVDFVKQNAPELFGTLKDGVITMPGGSMIAQVGEDLYLTDSEGLFAVALPGYQLTDYSSSFTYTGRLTDTYNNDYAQGTITFGDDVASAKYYVAADGDDIDAIIEAINEGELDAETISESGTSISVQLSETGYYYMVVITYNASGEMVGSSSTRFYFRSSTSTTSEASWDPILTGYFYYNLEPAFVTDQSGTYVGGIYEGVDEGVILYQNSANPNEYKVYPWTDSTDGLIFTMDSDGYISFINQNTGLTYEESGTTYIVYGSDFGTLLPDYTDGTPTSWVYQEGSYYECDFGTIYHINNYYGGYGYFGGAYEAFFTDPSGLNASQVKEIEDFAKVPRSLRKIDLTNNRISSSLINGVFNSKRNMFKKVLSNKTLSFKKVPADLKKLK